MVSTGQHSLFSRSHKEGFVSTERGLLEKGVAPFNSQWHCVWLCVCVCVRTCVYIPSSQYEHGMWLKLFQHLQNQEDNLDFALKAVSLSASVRLQR